MNTDYRGTVVSYISDGTGYPVVLLHGYLEAKEAWEMISAVLYRSYRVIAIDLPGHGASGIICRHTYDGDDGRGGACGH